MRSRPSMRWKASIWRTHPLLHADALGYNGEFKKLVAINSFLREAEDRPLIAPRPAVSEAAWLLVIGTLTISRNLPVGERDS